MYGALINVFHSFVIGPLFVYLGVIGERLDSFWFPTLLAIAAITVSIHAYLWFSRGTKPWVHTLHLALLSPLLVYIGLNQQSSSPHAFTSLYVIGFLVIFYHLFKIWSKILNYKIVKRSKK